MQVLLVLLVFILSLIATILSLFIINLIIADDYDSGTGTGELGELIITVFNNIILFIILFIIYLILFAILIF